MMKWGSRLVRRCWVTFSAGRPTNLYNLGQGRSVGASWGCLDVRWFFSSSVVSFSFSFSLGDGIMKTEILSQRGIKPNSPGAEICRYARKHFRSP